jgi:hypothetical protein
MHKTIVITPALFLLLCVGVPTLRAEISCRDYETQIDQRDMSRVIAVDRTVLPTFNWPATSANEMFALKGTLCGPSREALQSQTIHLVRYTDLRSQDLQEEALPAQAFTDGSARPEEDHEIHTTKNGKFSITGLIPGDYAILPDWEGLENQMEFVVFDIRLIPGQSIFLDAPKADVFGGL